MNLIADREYSDGNHHFLLLVLSDWHVSQRYPSASSSRTRWIDVSLHLGIHALHLDIHRHGKQFSSILYRVRTRKSSTRFEISISNTKTYLATRAIVSIEQY